MTTHDFKTTLDLLEIASKPKWGRHRDLREDRLLSWLENNQETIRTAMLIAEKVMGEPTDEMALAGNDEYDYGIGIENCKTVFKAMRDEMLKEIGQ